ncbi:MAG: hypothetical protein R2726_04425 [Acidimicrobiales bacterium]
MLTKRIAALGLAAALALPLAAACSKSSETSTGSNNNASSTTTTASGGGSGGNGSSGGGSGSNGTPSQADCIQAAGLYTKLIAAPSQALAPGQTFDAAAFDQELAQIKGSVPDDLKADMQTFADAYSQFINNVKDLDLSNPASFANPETAQKLQDATKPLDSAEVKKAQDNIDAYFKKCQTSTP